MNNIVENYLMFKANNICRYINILAMDMRKVSKIPKQLDNLIYKYYDLFILSDKKVDYDLLRTKTGLDDDNERLLLFYLLIEFDMASKTEYQDQEYYNFYKFLVDSIIIFSLVENSKVLKKEINYDRVISKVLKDNNKRISNEFILLLENNFNELSKEFNNSLKKEIKCNELYCSQVYNANYTKIKRGNDIYFEKLKYKNNKLNDESKKDVLLVSKEYDADLNFVNLELTAVRIVRDVLCGLKRTVFVRLGNEIITKKSNLNVFLSMIRLRFLKERIIFLVNTSLLEKYEDRIGDLILKDFKISYFKDSTLVECNLYDNGGYMIIEYDDLKEGIEFSKKYNLEVIVNKVNKKDVQKLNNIKYLT